MVYSRLAELSHHNKICQRKYKTMSDNIIQLNEDLIKHDLRGLVRSSVEETLMPCSTKKLMNRSMPRSTNIPVAVRVTVPGIIRGIFRRLPGKWNLMFPS